MPIWTILDARKHLKSLLGDNDTDKLEFRAVCHPPPDGLTRRFFVGQTRLVRNSLQVYVSGIETVPAETDPPNGGFLLTAAPGTSGTVEATFRYTWFTDTDLTDYLTAASNLLTFDSVSVEIDIGLRPALLDFACYYAYMRKAAEWADFVSAGAGGYTADQSRPHPNWRSLADSAFAKAKEKLQIYIDNPLSRAAPAIRFVNYRMQNYVPMS